MFLFILAILFAILGAIIYFVKEVDGIKLRRWATIPFVLAAPSQGNNTTLPLIQIPNK